jgi:hypothetical protein
VGAPTNDVLEVTGRPAEDFETIARRYAAMPRNRQTLANQLRELAQSVVAPFSPGFNLERYDFVLVARGDGGRRILDQEFAGRVSGGQCRDSGSPSGVFLLAAQHTFGAHNGALDDGVVQRGLSVRSQGISTKTVATPPGVGSDLDPRR